MAPIETYLIAGRQVNRHFLKGRLLAEGFKTNRCESCGLSDWRGRTLSLALHHVNGDGGDNRLENLQLLCPNCHSQTENFSAKNAQRRRVLARQEALLQEAGAVSAAEEPWLRLLVVGTVS